MPRHPAAEVPAPPRSKPSISIRILTLVLLVMSYAASPVGARAQSTVWLLVTGPQQGRFLSPSIDPYVPTYTFAETTPTGVTAYRTFEFTVPWDVNLLRYYRAMATREPLSVRVDFTSGMVHNPVQTTLALSGAQVTRINTAYTSPASGTGGAATIILTAPEDGGSERTAVAPRTRLGSITQPSRRIAPTRLSRTQIRTLQTSESSANTNSSSARAWWSYDLGTPPVPNLLVRIAGTQSGTLPSSIVQRGWESYTFYGQAMTVDVQAHVDAATKMPTGGFAVTITMQKNVDASTPKLHAMMQSHEPLSTAQYDAFPMDNSRMRQPGMLPGLTPLLSYSAVPSTIAAEAASSGGESLTFAVTTLTVQDHLTGITASFGTTR